jgi:hypothetical protein
VVIYLSRKRHATLGSSDMAQVKHLLSLGYRVAVPDLCGFGERGEHSYRGGGADAFDVGGTNQTVRNRKVVAMAMFLGRSVVGVHAADLLMVADYFGCGADGVVATVSMNQTVSAVLHASLIGYGRYQAGNDVTGVDMLPCCYHCTHNRSHMHRPYTHPPSTRPPATQ